MVWALEVRGLVKRYGGRTVLDGVDLLLAPGDKALLLGRNGSGKSTLLRAACGLVQPDAGRVVLFGAEPGEPSAVGYAGHASMLYRDLSVEENLRFFARLYGLTADEALRRTDHVLDRFNLGELRAERVRVLSQGQLSRVALARALVHDPPLLLLDEPFAALDAAARTELVELLRAERDRTVLLATHQLDFPPESADLVLTLDEGRLLPERAAAPVSGRAPQVRRRSSAAALPVLFAKELRVAWRDARRLRALALFGVALALIVGRAFRDDAGSATALSAAIWLVALFAQLLFLGQVHAAEAANGCFDGLRLSPVSRWVLSCAKSAAASVLAGGLTLFALCVVAFLSSAGQLLAPAVLALLAIETVGVTAIGQVLLAPSATDEEPGLDAHAFVLLAAAPLLFFGVDATALLLGGVGAAELARYYAFLGAYAAVLIALAAVAFGGFVGDTSHRSRDDLPAGERAEEPTG